MPAKKIQIPGTFRPRDAAAFFQLNIKVITDAITAGDLPATKGKRTQGGRSVNWIARADLEKWLKSRRKLSARTRARLVELGIVTEGNTARKPGKRDVKKTAPPAKPTTKTEKKTANKGNGAEGGGQMFRDMYDPQLIPALEALGAELSDPAVLAAAKSEQVSKALLAFTQNAERTTRLLVETGRLVDRDEAAVFIGETLREFISEIKGLESTFDATTARKHKISITATRGVLREAANHLINRAGEIINGLEKRTEEFGRAQRAKQRKRR